MRDTDFYAITNTIDGSYSKDTSPLYNFSNKNQLREFLCSQNLSTKPILQVSSNNNSLILQEEDLKRIFTCFGNLIKLNSFTYESPKSKHFLIF